MPLSIGLSLAAAVLLQSRLVRFKPLLRTALFAPVVTTLVAAENAITARPSRTS